MRRLSIAAAAAALLAASPTLADIGPKPTMWFAFPAGAAITGGDLLQCEGPTCADGQPLRVQGPQRFVCEAASCHAQAYGFAPYAQLRITFADGRTLTSNVFPRGDFNGQYAVTFEASGLLVTPKSGS